MSSPRGVLTDAVSALPCAVNPLALSLNENPFPPLPTGFGKSTLKVGLQFVYDPRAR